MMKNRYYLILFVLLLTAVKGYAYAWEGKGTEAEPYLIQSTDDLLQLADSVNGGEGYNGKYFKLEKNLNFTGKTFTPIGKDDDPEDLYDDKLFQGIFDGNGHTIRGINISGDYNVGIFGLVLGATIKNLTVNDCSFTGTNGVGAIVGYQEQGAGSIINCHVSNTVSVSGEDFVGGIAGSLSYYSIENCTCAAEITCYSDFGAIVGYASDEVTDNEKCYFSNNKYYLQPNVVGSKAYTGEMRPGSEEPVRCYKVKIIGDVSTDVPNQILNQITPVASFTSNGVYYFADGTSITLPIIEGVSYIKVNDSHLNTIEPNENTFTMPSDDVVITVSGGGGEVTPEIELQNNADNSQTISDNNDKTVSVRLTDRTLFKNGSWNTLCLPFDVTITDSPLKGADVRTLQSSSFNNGKLTLTFTSVTTTIPAGTPVIVKWESGENLDNPVFEGVTISQESPGETSSEIITFKGTYAPITITGEDKTKLFMGSDSKLYYPNGQASTNINAFRGYFQLADGYVCGENTPVSGAKSISHFVLDFGDGQTTSIIVIQKPQMTDGEDTWYLLDGRRLNGSPTKAGVYIVNGKKIVIK